MNVVTCNIIHFNAWLLYWIVLHPQQCLFFIPSWYYFWACIHSEFPLFRVQDTPLLFMLQWTLSFNILYAEMSTSTKSIKKNLWWPHTKQPSLLWLCNYCNCQQYAQYNSIHFFFTKLQDQKNESCFDDIKKKVWRNGPLQFWCFEYLNVISIHTLNKELF